MSSHAQKQREFIELVMKGLVGVILVLAHAFSAFSPSFNDSFFEIENRSMIAGPVTILEIAWSGIMLTTANYTTPGSAGSTILAGLGGLAAALFLLLVAGGARNWMAGTLLVFIAFWGGVLLEFHLHFVARLVARATGSPYPPPPDPHGLDMLSPPWFAPRSFKEAWRQAVQAQARAAQAPPAYEQPSFTPSPEATTPLLPPRDTYGTPPKPAGDN